MTPADLLGYAEQALLLSVWLVLPIIGIAALVGLVIAALQAATQIQDPTISHLPRFVAVALALAILAPGLARQVGQFAERMFVMAASR